MLEKLKLMLGIEDEQTDEILLLMIEDTITAILNYCHIKTLPIQLEYIVRELIVSTFKLEAGDSIASIKRGDTQITYTNTINPNSFTDKHKSAMNSFRRISR